MMDTNSKIEFVRDNFKLVEQLETLHPLETSCAYIRGLLTAWHLDGTVRWEVIQELQVELSKLSAKVRKRFENNEG